MLRSTLDSLVLRCSARIQETQTTKEYSAPDSLGNQHITRISSVERVVDVDLQAEDVVQVEDVSIEGAELQGRQNGAVEETCGESSLNLTNTTKKTPMWVVWLVLVLFVAAFLFVWVFVRKIF